MFPSITISFTSLIIVILSLLVFEIQARKNEKVSLIRLTTITFIWWLITLWILRWIQGSVFLYYGIGIFSLILYSIFLFKYSSLSVSLKNHLQNWKSQVNIPKSGFSNIVQLLKTATI